MLHRRTFLTAAAAAAALPAVVPAAAFAQAAAPTPEPNPATPVRAQVPAFFRVKVGDALVTAVGDGGFDLPAKILPGVSDEEFAAAMRAQFLPEAAFPAGLNTFVVELAGNTVLVDTGAPAGMAPSVGHAMTNLAAAGYAPADITHVLLTHMHSDHTGNLVDTAGGAVFPNAALVVRDRELAFWTDPAEAGRIPEGQRNHVELATKARAAYADRLTTFADDVAVLDGIEAVALYGHTPGHTGYRVAGELLIWGDLAHVIPVQMAKPDVAIAFDVTPADAVAVRKATLETLAAERTMVAGMHVPFPAFGHVVAEGAGYRFVPAQYRYAL
jgi:glyoxylase-like metal-dependent hydrolase (beta-lactamase superfamily II)